MASRARRLRPLAGPACGRPGNRGRRIFSPRRGRKPRGRFAALLGKDMAVYLPTGTLANHLALRRLARDGRPVLVQQESHVYNDEAAHSLRARALLN